jgi:hypothetical protein
MNTDRPVRCPRLAPLLLAAILTSASLAAHADEHEDLEKLRATVLGLIDTLVKNRIIPKDKADEMMREAEARANARLAQTPPPEVGADGKKIVRVPYIPDAVKVQMHDQIKAEVLAETKTERMGMGPPDEDHGRIQMEGDLRLRAETWRLNSSNTPTSAATASAMQNDGGIGLTRFPDYLVLGTGGIPNYNSQQDVARARLRARLGFNATVSDTVKAGIYLATGTQTVPTSTMQTMGTSPGNFNKESVWVDRAFIQYTPNDWLSMSGGRISNPYFHTDLVWADDLNFEGFAMTVKPHLDKTPNSYFTAGWFPLSVGVPNQTVGRSLVAVQGGAEWQLGQRDNRIKLGAALYDYKGLAGVSDAANCISGSSGCTITVPNYGDTSYISNANSRGNTLFRLNAPSDTGTTYWGYASDFRELNLTGTMDLVQFDPLHVILTGDYVKNLAFSRGNMQSRTGIAITDGSGLGYMGKIQIGAPKMARYGDWNVSLAYRYLGSDAVVDAFTNNDFGLGCTNCKGSIVGVNYGLDRNTWLSARLYASDLIDSMVPSTATGGSVPTNFSVDFLQVDLNTKF